MANKFTTQTYDYINQINKNFWVLTDIFLAMTPAIHMDTFDAMKFLSLAPKRNMLRGGGCFKADFTNFAPPSGGPHFGDTVGYASRSIPFCSSKFRDQASVRMSFAASEYDWVIPFAEGKAPKTMQEAGKIMLSEIKKHLTSINSFQQSVAVNQLKEGSPVLIDLAALTAADHANEPYIPEMITNKQLSQVQTILANLRQNVDNMFFVPAADQYDLIHSQPLDKNFYTTKSDMVANTYKYYGMSTDELKRAGSFYEYAGMKIRKYTSIKTWNVNAQNTIRGPLVFETKPTFYEGTGISYYKATIKNNGASTIYIRPGDLLYYKGDNALCHIDRATKAPVYPLRWCFSVTSQKWIDDNKGYPGSYYEDPTAGVIDFRGTLYDDIAYEVAAGASLEISVRNELVYETSSPESRNNNVNRNLDLNTDEFWIFPTADPNFLFNKGSFFYYNLDMSVLSPHIMDGAQIFNRATEAYLKKTGSFDFGPLRPRISLEHAGPSTSTEDVLYIGINAYKYSDTLGDEFNYILPTTTIAQSNNRRRVALSMKAKREAEQAKRQEDLMLKIVERDEYKFLAEKAEARAKAAEAKTDASVKAAVDAAMKDFIAKQNKGKK